MVFQEERKPAVFLFIREIRLCIQGTHTRNTTNSTLMLQEAIRRLSDYLHRVGKRSLGLTCKYNLKSQRHPLFSFLVVNPSCVHLVNPRSSLHKHAESSCHQKPTAKYISNSKIYIQSQAQTTRLNASLYHKSIIIFCCFFQSISKEMRYLSPNPAFSGISKPYQVTL